jgi:hypothetical protein
MFKIHFNNKPNKLRVYINDNVIHNIHKNLKKVSFNNSVTKYSYYTIVYKSQGSLSFSSITNCHKQYIKKSNIISPIDWKTAVCKHISYSYSSVIYNNSSIVLCSQYIYPEHVPCHLLLYILHAVIFTVKHGPYLIQVCKILSEM